jgi:hypothetical protein
MTAAFKDDAKTPKLDFINTNKDDDIKNEKVLLSSYPRSGNTLIRSYLEKITSLYTGSDCDVKRKLNKDL